MPLGSPHRTLADLPAGAVVGTLSVRRSAQLLRNYPHLRFESVRGNVQTRLRKLDDPEGPYACLLLAAAGLIRVDLAHRITKCLDPPEMYYAVGQGALGVEIRKGDQAMEPIMRLVEHLPTTYRCLSERAVMNALEGGCSVPIGVHSEYDETTHTLSLAALVVSVDGTQAVEKLHAAVIASKQDAVAVGIEVARQLEHSGAKAILDAINFERINQPPSAAPTPLVSRSATPSLTEWRPPPH